MATIENLQEKLIEAQEKFNQIVSELNAFSSLKESFESSDQGLKDAANHLDELTKVVDNGARALNRSAESMKEAIDLLKKTDPAVVTQILNKLVEETEKTYKLVENVEASSKKFIEYFTEKNIKIDSDLKNIQSRIESLESKFDQNKEILEAIQKRKGILF